MFARCLHFWAKMLVSWDRQTQPHWWTAVAPLRGDDCDAEGGEELRAFSLSVPLETRPAGPTHPVSPPLWSSYDGNTGRGLRIIGNFNPLKAIIQNKTFQIYSSGVVLFVSSMCSCFRNILPCFCPHIQSLFCLFPLSFDSFNAAQAFRDIVSCMCLRTVPIEDCVFELIKQFPVVFLSCDSDVTISSLSS